MDDDNTLIDPGKGVPHANIPSPGYELLTSCFSRSDPSSKVHNPYGCFGAPDIAWPRGYPLSEIQHQGSDTCELAARDHGIAGPRIGVVQSLANHDPDVDAIYRLTYPPGGLPFKFTPKSPAAPGSRLRGVPAETMTPFNSQVITSHRLLTYSGLKRRSASSVLPLRPRFLRAHSKLSALVA